MDLEVGCEEQRAVGFVLLIVNWSDCVRGGRCNGRRRKQAIEDRRRSHVEAARQLQRANGCAHRSSIPYAGIKIIKRLTIN